MAEKPQEFTAEKLITEGAFFNINFNDHQTEEEQQEDDLCKLENLKYLNLDCAEIADEDVYVDGEPFSAIASRMEPLYGYKVMKRVLRPGYGLQPTELSTVVIHYHAYVEHEVEPFDSTYARKRPHRFTLQRGEVIPGLEIAVKSMRITEKSQFLIDHEFAYGENGCLSRVPPKATILFEVELIAIPQVGDVEKFEQLSEDKQQEFEKVYDYCSSLKNRGNEYFKNKHYKNAIREYNRARDKLEKTILKDMDEQEKQQELIKLLLVNLLICYTCDKHPKMGCVCFNTLNDMARETNIRIPAKAYYHNAKCLKMLGDYKLAMRRLKRAQQLCPTNEDIVNEMAILKGLIDNDEQNEKEGLKKMAAGIISDGRKAQ